MANLVEKPKPYEMLPKPNVKRKSGGQPGNLNSFKHGFYSRRFRGLEIADLGTVLTDSLDDEIALVRVVVRRVFELADQEAETLDDWQSALSTLGAASTRLAGLLRTQQMMTGSKGGADIVLQALSESIGIVANELGINNKK
ncbi:MAG: hypothetical protein Q7J07_07735 [Pelolinea sp.]|nr:hypothetical protein [Pelolinea sp.]